MIFYILHHPKHPRAPHQPLTEQALRLHSSPDRERSCQRHFATELGLLVLFLLDKDRLSNGSPIGVHNRASVRRKSGSTAAVGLQRASNNTLRISCVSPRSSAPRSRDEYVSICVALGRQAVLIKYFAGVFCFSETRWLRWRPHPAGSCCLLLYTGCCVPYPQAGAVRSDGPRN